jgi:peptidoglycan/LPS O-acetylase OafA/YrhL
MYHKQISTKEETISNNFDIPKASVPSNTPHRSFGLDLARTIAISLVLMSHFGHKALDALGFWGVELFFALSGFLIGQILWRNFSRTNDWTRAHIVNFWQRRWWRTLPNYYLFLSILLISGFINNEEVPSLGNLSKFFWFGQFLFNHNWGFYSVSWSLCIEEWFYLLFPLLLLITSTIIGNRKISFILSLIIIILGSIVIRNILINQNPIYYLRGITLARLDAIAYGVVVAFVTLSYEIKSNQRYFSLLIGISLQIFSISDAYIFGLAHTVASQLFLILVPLSFALMIPYLSILPTPNVKYHIATDSIEKVSLWSYSIYLSHGPLMWLVYFLFKEYRDNFYGNFLSKVIGLALTMVASAALYNFFEVPFTKMRPKELK